LSVVRKRWSREGVTLELVVRSRDGRVISRKKVRTHSYVLNYYRVIKALMDCAGGTQAIDTGNASFYIACPNTMKILALEGDDTYGIQVGSGTTAPTPSDIKLENQIPHGDESGKLHYKDTGVYDVVVDGSEIHFDVERDFVNNSGADIVVYEIGEVVKVNDTDGNEHNVMILRHVESGGITVPNGATLTVKITHKVTT